MKPFVIYISSRRE